MEEDSDDDFQSIPCEECQESFNLKLKLRNHQALVHNRRRKRKKPDPFPFSQEMELGQPENCTAREEDQREEEPVTIQSPRVNLQARSRLSILTEQLRSRLGMF